MQDVYDLAAPVRASLEVTGRAYSRPAALVDVQTFIGWWTSMVRELGTTDQPDIKLQRSYLDDIKQLAPWLRPFGVLWWQEIQHWRQQSVSARTLRALKQLAANDLLSTAEHLAGCDPKVLDAWRTWYPAWIRGEVMAAAERDPALLLPAEQVRRMLLDAEAQRKAESRRHARSVALANAAWTISDKGLLIGDPEAIARRVSSVLGLRGSNAATAAELAALFGRLAANGTGRYWPSRNRHRTVRFLFIEPMDTVH